MPFATRFLHVFHFLRLLLLVFVFVFVLRPRLKRRREADCTKATLLPSRYSCIQNLDAYHYPLRWPLFRDKVSKSEVTGCRLMYVRTCNTDEISITHICKSCWVFSMT